MRTLHCHTAHDCITARHMMLLLHDMVWRDMITHTYTCTFEQMWLLCWDILFSLQDCCSLSYSLEVFEYFEYFKGTQQFHCISVLCKLSWTRTLRCAVSPVVSTIHIYSYLFRRFFHGGRVLVLQKKLTQSARFFSCVALGCDDYRLYEDGKGLRTNHFRRRIVTLSIAESSKPIVADPFCRKVPRITFSQALTGPIPESKRVPNSTGLYFNPFPTNYSSATSVFVFQKVMSDAWCLDINLLDLVATKSLRKKDPWECASFCVAKDLATLVNGWGQPWGPQFVWTSWAKVARSKAQPTLSTKAVAVLAGGGAWHRFCGNNRDAPSLRHHQVVEFLDLFDIVDKY